MYKKIARIGPISLGIFYALMTLLMLIITALLGVFVLPFLELGESEIPIDAFPAMLEGLKQGQGIVELATFIGFMLLASFLIGFISAIIYNIVAVITGGIKVRVTDLGYDDI